MPERHASAPVRAGVRSRLILSAGLTILATGWPGFSTLAMSPPEGGDTQDGVPTQDSTHQSDAGADAAKQTSTQHVDINEYRIEGAHILPQEEIEEAVYPFLGPDRTAEDVEKARAALEKAYTAKGYQTVAVEIPQQQVRDGIVQLKVVEGTVGRLRVKGSRYFSLDDIKAQAPSLAEGSVPNFNDVTKDVIALNQIPDRRVTPALRAGITPGTVDVDLNVEDSLPLHGSLELNNRYSQDTSHLRLVASGRYDNLWQLGHSISLIYQIAPENPSDAKVFSGSYLARFPDVSWLGLLLYGTKNSSNVSTVGNTNVNGRGEVIGLRAIITLPGNQDFFHTITAGVDYKHFEELLTLGSGQLSTPITYYPFSALYSATWQDGDGSTQLDAGLTFSARGLGSNSAEFDAKRFRPGLNSGNFSYFRGDLSRTQELPLGLQLAGKLQGQLSSDPLVSSEELSGGGLDTVRGYLESEVIGDNGLLGSAELRSPSVAAWIGAASVIDDWRFYAFGEGGKISINAPLTAQQSQFDLASFGLGTKAKLLGHLNGSLDVAVPVISEIATRSGTVRVSFRAWSDF